MNHLGLADFNPDDVASGVVELTPPNLASLSRDLAMAAARLPDRRLRLLAAMQVLGNLRDFLVADISEGAQRSIDDAIQALMRNERELPVDWAT